MLTERELLIEIIQNTPKNSVWNISSDSWEKIPEVFLQFPFNQGLRHETLMAIDLSK
jgi:hypothetical protein